MSWALARSKPVAETAWPVARGRQAEPKMSDTGLIVLSMTESPSCYDVTATVQRPGPRQSCPLAIHDRVQRSAGLAGVVAQGGGDAGLPGQPQDGDCQVAQAGHHAGAVGGADLGAVFVVGDVADPVQPVLD